jgi:hypothetical protein
MTVVTASVRIDGKPLKRTYVEHTGPFGLGSLGFYLTDGNGSFTIDAGLFSDKVDVKIHCQNSVVRVVNGASLNSGIFFHAFVGNGEAINITDHVDHYKILNSCLNVYDAVWRQFNPYSISGRGDFPLGKKATIKNTFMDNKRIELSYPDAFPSLLAFVEPSGLTNAGFPLVHVKNRIEDGRLFGEADSINARNYASLIPHELGHAFHFSALIANTRTKIEIEYLAWIANQTFNNRDATHNTTVVTVPIIAFIEATGMFSERFFIFKDKIEPMLSGSAIRQAFFRDELSQEPRLEVVLGRTYKQVGKKDENGNIQPLITVGDNVEGSVYGAIYLDLASRIGLKKTVDLVLHSNATTFDDFRLHILGKNVSQLTNAINAVKRTWHL